MSEKTSKAAFKVMPSERGKVASTTPIGRVAIEMTERMAVDIEKLWRTGLFGPSTQAVIEECLRHRLRELEVEGWMR